MKLLQIFLFAIVSNLLLSQDYGHFDVHNPSDSSVYYVAISEPYENIVMGWFVIAPLQTRRFPVKQQAYVYVEGPNGFVKFEKEEKQLQVRKSKFSYYDWEQLDSSSIVTFTAVLPGKTYQLPVIQLNASEHYVLDEIEKGRIAGRESLLLEKAAFAGRATVNHQDTVESSEISNVLNDLKQEALELTPQLSKAYSAYSDLGTFSQNILNILHDEIIVNGEDFLSKKELRHYKDIEYLVSQSSFSRFTIVEYNQLEKKLVFNANFFSKLIDFTYLTSVSSLNYKGYENILEIYKNTLQFIPSQNELGDVLKLNAEDKITDEHKAIELIANFSLVINIFYLEMHELYHVVYGRQHELASNEEEVRADSFALVKLNELIKSNFLAENAKSLNLEAASLLSLPGILFNYMESLYKPKMHRFANTVKSLNYRFIKYADHLNKLVCDHYQEGSGCDSVVTPDRTLEISNTLLRRYEDIDAKQSIESLSELTDRDIYIKVNMMLFDGEFEKLSVYLESLLGKAVLLRPNLKEFIIIVLLELYQVDGKEEAIAALLNAHDVQYGILPKRYFDDVLELYTYSDFSHNDFFSNLHQAMKDDLLLEIEKTAFKEAGLRLPYTANFGISDEVFYGEWSGAFSRSGSPTGKGIFYFSTENLKIIYRGEISNSGFNGFTEVWTAYTDVDTERSNEGYLSANFVDNFALGKTYVRMNRQGVSLLLNLEDKYYAEGLVTLWLEDGGISVGDCFQCDIFKGDGGMSGFRGKEDQDYERTAMTFGLEFAMADEKISNLTNCFVEGPILPLIYDRVFINFAKSGIISFLEEARVNRSVNGIESLYALEPRFRNPVYLYGVSKLKKCLEYE